MLTSGDVVVNVLDATTLERNLNLTVQLIKRRTPMVVVLTDGTELKGWIEWYDKTCIKLNRTDAPNLLLFKHSIKVMFKEEELHVRRRRRSGPPRGSSSSS